MPTVARLATAAALAVTAFLGLAPPASAAESIPSYAVSATVQADGSLSVRESITYDFGDAERRGIFRTIPMWSELPDGSLWRHPATVRSVSMDGADAPYSITEEGAFLEIRIGDPDVTITGSHVYEIDYVVEGVLRSMTQAELAESNPYGFAPGDVELYWDFIGTGWPVDIDLAFVEVQGPSEVLAAQCFTGGYGAAVGCTDRILGDAAQFRQELLFAGEGLTAVIAYSGSAFPAAPVRVIEAPPISRSPGQVLPVSLAIAVLALLAPPVAAILARRRIRGVDIPYAPVQYSPPRGLRPAELSVGLDGDLDSRGVLATLLDLVARKHITLSSDPGGFMRQSRIDLRWWGAGSEPLLPWEEALLSQLFQGRDEATLQGYDPGFATAVAKVRDDLKAEALATARLNPRMSSVRGGVIAAASVLLILTIITFFAGIFTDNALVYAGVLPVAVALTVGLFVAAAIVPDQETVQSAKFEAEIEGFKRMLDTDPAVSRRELVQRLGLPDYAVFATFLPYAVLFGLEGSWSGAFPDLTQEQLRSAGLFGVSTAALTNAMSVGATTVGAAYTAPKSSGGSGFSSGGGFSGGGGGGGGGGSW
jgi:hypothetical protein